MFTGPKDHINIRILHTRTSGIPLIAGHRTRMYDPYVYVVFWARKSREPDTQGGLGPTQQPLDLSVARLCLEGHGQSSLVLRREGKELHGLFLGIIYGGLLYMDEFSCRDYCKDDIWGLLQGSIQLKGLL